MSGRTANGSVVLAVAVALVSLTGAAMAQQLHTVPFDTALSIYVGHDGTWHRYDTAQDEEEEIEDALGAFQASEEVSDDPDIWVDHQVNDPPSPSGWTFFSAVDAEPMSLHVMVADTQDRLGQIVVTDRYTGATVGTLTANAQGSSINGSLAVDPTREAFRLELKAKGTGTTMARFQVINPRVEDGIVVPFYYGWVPNRGDEHTPCPETNLGPPWGNPETYAGKVSTAAMEENRSACCGNTAYTNDLPQQSALTPKYNLLNHKPLQNVNFDGTNTGSKVDAEVQAALTAARLDYINGQTYLGQLALPPYSQGVSHFPAEVYGQIRSLLLFPYKGVTSRKIEITPSLQGEMGYWRPAGVDHSDPSYQVAAKVTLTEDQRKKFQVLKPVAIGDLWCLRSNANGAPLSLPTQPLTQPVTFELWGDKVGPPPPGVEGLLGGSGTATRLEAWTNPAPPPLNPANHTLTFPSTGPDKGKCTVQLGKGWYWRVKGQAPAHYSEAVLDNLQTPCAATVRLDSALLTCLLLKITTGANQCLVELQRYDNQQWQAAGSSTTVLENGIYTWNAGIRSPAQYRVRAQRTTGPMPRYWGNWVEFAVTPATEQTQPVTAP